MSVRIVPARSKKGFEYDIWVTWPEGGRVRERGKCPLSGKDACRRWAEARERTIAAGGKAAYRPLSAPAAPAPGVLTLSTFWPRVLTDHYKASRKKPSTIEDAERRVKNQIAPVLGDLPIDKIGPAEIAKLKGSMSAAAPKSVNNVLGVLSRILACAHEWGLIPGRPKMGMLRVSEEEADWYEIDDYRALVNGARGLSMRHLLLVLLAGSAGLRRGEIQALNRSDIDLSRRLIHVNRAFWDDVEGLPKGNRTRVVPMTPELLDALEEHLKIRRMTGDRERLIVSHDGLRLSNRTVRNWMRQCRKRAGLPLLGDAKNERDNGGGIHMLRHTFCSHLAIAGVPAKAIQELAGHTDLKTTMRYMHLSPTNRSDAISALGRLYAGTKTKKAAEK